MLHDNWTAWLLLDHILEHGQANENHTEGLGSRYAPQDQQCLCKNNYCCVKCLKQTQKCYNQEADSLTFPQGSQGFDNNLLVNTTQVGHQLFTLSVAVDITLQHTQTAQTQFSNTDTSQATVNQLADMKL